MEFYKNSGTANAATPSGTQKRSSRQNISTLEYGIIANLVTGQYQQGDNIKFDALLSIPLSERIPGLMQAYGKKTMHKLLVMILKEFSATLVLTKAKKMTDTGLSVAACEIMLSSFEDHLSLEDLILFLQRAKAGKYGIIRNMATPYALLNLMEQYRQARHEALLKIRDAQHAATKEMGDTARTASEPTELNNLLHQAFVIDISNRA